MYVHKRSDSWVFVCNNSHASVCACIDTYPWVWVNHRTDGYICITYPNPSCIITCIHTYIHTCITYPNPFNLANPLPDFWSWSTICDKSATFPCSCANWICRLAASCLALSSCECVCMYACMYVYARMNANMYAHIRIFMYEDCPSLVWYGDSTSMHTYMHSHM